ncbi:family 16 glycoside hydrolase [Pedobacter nyackensis]|uniref:family 16 glycoside hydrolase n=1 Tax=Pedobacter nyackensis TaxID=475255 RepID=UPI00292F7D6C|nr:family 16 glycoside hydrolase [Pedobacter nyackensis]
MNDLSEFKTVPQQWKLVGDISYDLNKPNKSEIKNGTGILVHTPKGQSKNILVSNLEHQNLALEFEFMLAKGSQTTLYLQGRYAIKLNDSWSNYELVSDARMNVCRAPGLWQKMQIFFQAPKFNNSGNKTDDATLLKVVYNGVTIQENVSFKEPSINSPLREEATTGPFMLSSNGAIALKDIHYLQFENPGNIKNLLITAPAENILDRQIIVNPQLKTIVQRCFIEYANKKRTFCAAVGDPDNIHYAIDLSQGTLINFWKGGFIDATSMWTSRGQIQIAVPLGSKFEITPSPNFAMLSNDKETWPEKQSDKFKFKGYKLDASGKPTFLYAVNDFIIEDKIDPQEKGRLLLRTYKISSGNHTNMLWFKLAEGTSIKQVGKDIYSINNDSYYIKYTNDQSSKAILRKTSLGNELIVPLSPSKNQAEIKYSIIW